MTFIDPNSFMSIFLNSVFYGADLKCSERQRFLTLNLAGFHAFALVPVFQTGCRGSQE